jgi:hypothetical protein
VQPLMPCDRPIIRTRPPAASEPWLLVDFVPLQGATSRRSCFGSSTKKLTRFIVEASACLERACASSLSARLMVTTCLAGVVRGYDKLMLPSSVSLGALKADRPTGNGRQSAVAPSVNAAPIISCRALTEHLPQMMN